MDRIILVPQQIVKLVAALELGNGMKCYEPEGARLKFVAVLLTIIFLAACSSAPAVAPIRAIYLVQREGQLPQAELDKHPEIFVTDSFEEFKKAARHRIGLWIDKNATQFVEEGWLDKMPQASYPIVLVGYNDPLVAFGYQLQLCCFMGHVLTDEEYAATESGFSVIERENGEPGAALILIQGFKQQPTVDELLKLSNDLLDGKVTPMPSPNVMP
jgi:hypothetical protein